MIDYINKIKRQFRDKYNFVPKEDDGVEPVFNEGQIPDGEYPMEIDGRIDNVEIKGGQIYCLRFQPKGEQPPKPTANANH